MACQWPRLHFPPSSQPQMHSKGAGRRALNGGVLLEWSTDFAPRDAIHHRRDDDDRAAGVPM